MGLRTWLAIEATHKKAALFTGLTFVAVLVWSIGLLLILSLLDRNLLAGPPDTPKLPSTPIFSIGFFILLGLGVLAEETFFRYMPLMLAAASGFKIEALLFISVISSALFGYIHGGFPYIAFQGVTGFLLCLLFLKCGGLHGHHFKALTASTLAHFSIDMFVAIAMYLHGERYF